MYNANHEEQKILEFWDKDKTFEKSIKERPEKKRYVFYDGPPFATGTPHYGHIVASAMKDLVPRFWTMRGFRVERRWGWDCHGLPIENIIEKDLNLTSKKDIENFGIANFNEACRATVMKYAEEWKKTIRLMGRWVDMENDYRTMDVKFMESVWWVFRQLWDKGLIYKGHKPMHICPRCVTPLSNFEVTQGYKDIKDLSATAKFKVLNNEISEKLNIPKDTSILAWTTTPWTLPGNVLLAVNEDVDYDLIKVAPQVDGEEVAGEERYAAMENYLIARERIKDVLKDKGYLLEASYKGKELVGLIYEPLFPYYKDTPNAFRVVAADFVSTQDGTGVVHIAPAYGEDDFGVGKRENLPLVQHVGMDGRFAPAVRDFAGQEVKPVDDVMRTDLEMIKYLAAKGRLFSKQKIEHSYPHCWRCETPLLNYAATSWFVRVSEMREQLLKNNEAINWVPDHIKIGRFGKWLEGARDWAISRSRYWGTPLPIWEADDGDVICVGSVSELEELTKQKITDLHLHKISGFAIEKNGKKYRPINEVLDCWFESGSMPYGEMHYPFENKEKFEETFPAEFIAEGQDQTRGWFYTLHILATALTSGKKPSIASKSLLSKLSFSNTGTPAFKNVIVNGIVQAEDGKKMSKKLKNYPDPEILMQKYGADAMRYYLVSSPVVEAESLFFSEAGVREMFNKYVNTLFNVLEFYQMFSGSEHKPAGKSKNILDRWILAKLQKLVNETTKSMEAYKLNEASRPIVDFITELSQWYVRRSRDRFKGDDAEDKAYALGTLHEVLLTVSKVAAPFTPFIAEKVYGSLVGNGHSVHLEKWPDTTWRIDEKVIGEMETLRKIVEMGLSLRAESGIKVRQVLSELSINGHKFDEGALKIIAEELNVNKVVYGNVADTRWIVKEDGELKVALNTELTAELKKQGLTREIIRLVNQIRKDLKLTVEDRVVIKYFTEDQSLTEVFRDCGEEIKKGTLADKFENQDGGEPRSIDERQIKISVQKI